MNIQSILHSKAGWGMTALRIPIGIIFMGHGMPKFGWLGERNLEMTAGFMESIGLPAPGLMAYLAASAETFGGLALILGLLTRPAALSLAIAMFVAIFWVHWPNGLLAEGGYQWALALFAASVALLFEGAGKLSLDNLLNARLSPPAISG